MNQTILFHSNPSAGRAQTSESLRIPLSNLTAQARGNLSAILTTKHHLLLKAIPGFSLEKEYILITHPTTFPPQEKAACLLFTERLLLTASTRKWVVPERKNSQVPSSEKYLFRIWLNQLGLKGPEFASTRKILMRNLSGSSAYSNDEKMALYNQKRKVENQKRREADQKREEDRLHGFSTELQSFILLP